MCLSDSPDEIEIHSVEQCTECGASLKDVCPKRYIVRQIIDIPDIKVKIVEHRVEVKICPQCKSKNTASFPKEIKNKIRNSITSSTGAVHFDETSIYVDKKCQWLHVASDENLTYYECHGKRRQKAIDDITILTNFTGTAVHDGFKTYYKYTKCNHALCNVHILRELNGITELQGQDWAKPMKNLLLEIKNEVDLTRDKHSALPLDKIQYFESKYDKILTADFDEDHAKNIELYSKKKVLIIT